MSIWAQVIHLIQTHEITKAELFQVASAVEWRRAMQNTNVPGVDDSQREWKQVSAFGYVANPDAFGTARMTPRNPTYHARPSSVPVQIDLFFGTSNLKPR